MRLTKLITSILIALFPLFSNAQSFVGKDAHLYKGATVKPIVISESLQSYYYKGFYSKFDTITKVLTKEPIGKKKLPFKPFQTGESYRAYSDYQKLVGVEFKVTGVFEEATTSSYEKGRYFVLVLNNPTIGTIYYEYNSDSKYDLELEVVGGLSFPEGYFCSKIKEDFDKFENKKSFYSPLEAGFNINKVTTEKDTVYYLSARSTNSSLSSVSGKGFYLIFDNGQRIEKPNESVDVKVNDKANYVYSVFVILTKEDLKLLSEQIITDSKIYIYDSEVQLETAKLLKEYTKCLLLK